MEYTLKDYQDDAVRRVMKNLQQAAATYRQFGSLSQFSLSATTGAGKTVMAAAVIEALFFGNDEYDIEGDPGAVVLWFSDDPSLNEQSRARIHSASSELDGRLRMIGNTFYGQALKPGNVYFLNTQKLSKNSSLVRGDVDANSSQGRLWEPRLDDAQTSIYNVLRNTLENRDLTLYFVLDEAHRGMGATAKNRGTIVQRLINGANGVPPLPIVFGISATVERFDEAMRVTTGRAALPSVEVDPQLVQASGLLKDDIVLSIPAEEGVFDTVLLRRAVDKLKASTAAWDEYARQQDGSDRVVPLLVVQVADKPDTATLTRIVDTIYEAWPELGHDALANVFGEHQDLTVAGVKVPYLEPQTVQDATHVRVLLAKSAISTGWDCPRAEVLVSFRTAVDATHITQLLGRMVRTPLARRIESNQLLNSVDCLLPFFNRKTATAVAENLMRGGASGGPSEPPPVMPRRVLFDPVPLIPNPALDDELWERFESLPSQTLPKKDVKPIKRLTALAASLARDGIIEGAVAAGNEHLHAVLDGRAVQYKSALERKLEDVLTMSGEEATGRMGGGFSYSSFVERADPRAIEVSYRTAARALSPALCSSYVAHLMADKDDDELLDMTARVAALGLLPEVVAGVEHEADALVRQWLSQTRVARKGLSDERQAEYARLEGMSTQPERIALACPEKAQTDRQERLPDGAEQPLPLRAHHLLVISEEEDRVAAGMVPVDLNDWERTVLDAETQQPGFVAWYRNPDRGTRDSLAIPYRDGTGQWRAVRPDFIFFAKSQAGELVVDIVDPHGHHLSDAVPKLRGMADFTEQYGSEFRRIESIAKIGDVMRVLDLTKPNVRHAIREAEDAESLYRSSVAWDY